MKIVFFLAAFALLLSSCNMIAGSGRMASEKRNLPAFSEVESSGSLKVEITLGTSHEVEVEADDNILEHIITKVDDGRLIVRLEEGGYSNIHATIYVTMPEVRKLIASGSGSISSKGTLENLESIELLTTGSGSITVAVNAPSVIAELNGSGSITASGRTKNFTAKGSGSGTLKCKDLLSENTEVETNGSGSANVYASVSLVAECNGSGSITYHGNPGTTKIEDDGSGSIRKN